MQQCKLGLCWDNLVDSGYLVWFFGNRSKIGHSNVAYLSIPKRRSAKGLEHLHKLNNQDLSDVYRTLSSSRYSYLSSRFVYLYRSNRAFAFANLRVRYSAINVHSNQKFWSRSVRLGQILWQALAITLFWTADETACFIHSVSITRIRIQIWLKL